MTIDILRVLKTIPERKISSQILSTRCSDFQVNLPPQLPAISSDELIVGYAGGRKDRPFLRWSNEHSVGVRAADNQHAKLFNILNDLHDAMKSGAMKNGQGQKAASTLLCNLEDYSVSHFAAEEKLMESTG